MDAYARARSFMLRHARPLDMARWRYHFEGGAREDVLDALVAYQNPDGGFGHATEADCWNPNSSPIQTWAATEVMREVGLSDPAHPLIAGALRYLASGSDFDGGKWFNTVPSNNDHPHAPWWHTGSESRCHTDYNPTACLAGFIVRYAAPDSELHELGLRIARQAYDALMPGPLLDDMHTAACYLRMLDYCAEAECALPFDGDALRARLHEQVMHGITRDLAAWESGYICRPSQFIDGPASPYLPGNEDICAYECDFILRTQQPDGAWPIPWSWGDAYPAEWAISRLWWQGDVAVRNMLFLRAFGKA